MKQMPLALPMHAGTTFDTFVPGSNMDCLLYLQEGVASLVKGQQTFTYLWGAAGVGKTHLLMSVAQAATQSDKTCAWLSLESDVDADSTFQADIVLLDDCDQFNDEQQAAAFRAFIDAQTDGFWIVAAGLYPPVDLQVREDLRTRLGWGNIFALKPLSDEELQAALWHAFHSRGLVLSSSVQDYLLHHFARDMSSLMHLLGALDRYALASKRAITIPLIKSMLDDDEYASEIQKT